jgi:hypothetical protein
MDTIELFAAAAGVGQVLTEQFEPSTFQSVHDVGPCNRLKVKFSTVGTLPDWIDWRVETSPDRGATWQSGPAVVLWSGTTTQSKTVSTRPGTSVVAVEIPRGGFIRLLARRRGGSHDTAVLGVGTFENIAPKVRPTEEREPRRRTDLWGRPIDASRAIGGKRPL